MAIRFALEGQPEQLIVFELLANGQSARMILDTGAGTVLFGEEGAARLGLAVSDETVPGYGAGGAIDLKVAEVSELVIDGRVSSNLPVLISNQVELVMAHINLKIDGVAGYPLFAESTLDINFETSQLALTSERLLAGTPFDLPEISPLIIVDGEIAGHPARIAIDTGASATTLSMDLGSRFGEELIPESDLQGAGGAIESFRVPPVEIKIGEKSVSLDTIRASPFVASLSETVQAPIDAVLGLDWLKRFRVRFDYVGRLVTFG